MWVDVAGVLFQTYYVASRFVLFCLHVSLFYDFLTMNRVLWFVSEVYACAYAKYIQRSLCFASFNV